MIPLFTYVNAYLFRPEVKGIPLAPNAMVMFNSVHVERAKREVEWHGSSPGEWRSCPDSGGGLSDYVYAGLGGAGVALREQ